MKREKKKLGIVKRGILRKRCRLKKGAQKNTIMLR